MNKLIKVGSGHIRIQRGHIHKHTSLNHFNKLEEGGRLHKTKIHNHHISDSNIENLKESLKKLKIKTIGNRKKKYIDF